MFRHSSGFCHIANRAATAPFDNSKGLANLLPALFCLHGLIAREVPCATAGAFRSGGKLAAHITTALHGRPSS
jgi:hypothetical protein